MFQNTIKAFERKGLRTNQEIFTWWLKGRGLLNFFVSVILIATFLVILMVFNNGWVYFLLPYGAVIMLAINVLYSLGALIELMPVRYFDSKMNFDNLAPIFKKIFVSNFNCNCFSHFDLGNNN